MFERQESIYEGLCKLTPISSSSLIATPGRLLHLIVEMELELKSVQYIVFDEADRYVLPHANTVSILPRGCRNY